jgi:leucyl/phenylalanyl-tRNA--protein transferase
MIDLPWLENSRYRFPDPETAMQEPDGLLCASMKLAPDLVIDAYQKGIFPWYSEDQPVLWWSPNPRCVLFPDKFHISRSFRRTLNKNHFEIRVDTSFDRVMICCASPRCKDEEHGEGTWITPAMFNVYCDLHDQGHAHSIECWHDDKLVGGVYGVVIGDIFFGESMFSLMKDASKVALHYLCTRVQPYLLDAQVYSDHIASLGAECINRSDFIDIIDQRQHETLDLKA